MAARFNTLGQASPGASLSLSVDANAALLLDPPPAEVFPPWLVVEGDGGDYAICDAQGAVVRADATDIFNAGIATLSGSLQNAAQAHTAQTGGDLDLNGQILSLGDDGVAGLLLRHNIGDNAGGGGVAFGANDLHLYNEVSRAWTIPLDGSGTLFKFGAGALQFHTEALPPRVVAQRGNLELHNGNRVFNTAFYAVENLEKTNYGNVVLRGSGGVLMNVHDFMYYNNAHFLLENGAATARNRMYADGNLAITNATLFLGPDLSSIGHGGSSLVTVGAGGAIYQRGDMFVGRENDNNRHRFTLADGALYSGGGIFYAGFQRNNITEVLNGASFTSRNETRFSSGGGHTFTVDNATASFNRFDFGGWTWDCVLRICNRAEVGCDVLLMGSSDMRNYLEVNNARFTVRAMEVGITWGGHNQVVDLQEDARVTVGEYVMIGLRGANHRLRVARGATLDVDRELRLGNSESKPAGNTLHLAGGAVAAGSFNTYGASVLCVEFQPEGFGEARGLGELRVNGGAYLEEGLVLRPLMAKGMPGGVFRVLTADGGLDVGGIDFDPPEPPGGKWDWFVENDSLYIKFVKGGTLFMVR